jgi:hypothetical protein
MYQGGINKDVILNYINNTSLSYRLSADGIIYLQSLGVPQELTKAMILRDGHLQQQQPQLQGMPPALQQFYAQQPTPPPADAQGYVNYGAGQAPTFSHLRVCVRADLSTASQTYCVSSASRKVGLAGEKWGVCRCSIPPENRPPDG